MANLIITKFVQEGLDAYKAELTTAISELDKMSKSEQSLNSELKKTSTSVKENTSTVAENTNTNNKNAESIKAVSRAEKDLKTAQDILNQSTDGLTKKQIELREKISSVGGIIQKNSGTVRENTAFNKNLEVQLKSLIAEYGKENKAIGDSVVKQQSMRSEIRQTTQELARKLANDEINIATIYETTKGTAQLKDAMGDANKIISTLGSDTFGLDATLSVVQSVSAGFQVLQGVTALVGSENEDLQKTLVKLNAVMAITQGLQQVKNALEKEDAGRLGISILAQKLYTTAVGESTGAMLLFRQVMLGLGIGAVIAGIYLAVKAFQELGKNIADSAKQSKLLAESRAESLESIKGEVSSIYELVAIAKNENLSRKDRQKAIDELQSKYPDYLKNISLENINEDATNKLLIAQIDLLTKREQIKKLVGKKSEIENTLLNSETDLFKNNAGFFDKLLVGLYGSENIPTFVKNKTESIKSELKTQSADIDKAIQTVIDEIAKTGKSVFEDTGKSAGKSVKDGIKKEFEKPLKVDLKLEFSNDDFEKYYGDLIAKAQQEVKSLFTAELILGNNPQDNPQIRALLAQIEKLKLELEKAKFAYDALNPVELQRIESPITESQLPNLDNLTKRDTSVKPLTLAERIFGTVEQNDERIAELQSRIQDGLKVTEELTRIGSDIANVASQAISIRYKNEANALEESKNKGLISEKKYQQELAKIKNEEAKKQRAIDIAMAVAKVPLVVLQALSTAPNPIAGAVLAAIAGGLALAQVAILASAPLPKFKTGGLTDRIFKGSGYVTGKSHDNGGVNANLEGNEFVMQQTAVNKYGVNVFDKLNKGLLNPDIFALPRLDYSGINKQKSSIIINDYSKLEKLMDENNDLVYKLVNKEPIIVKTQKINDGIYR